MPNTTFTVTMCDRSERHRFRLRFLLIHSPFFLPSFFMGGRETGKRITKVVVKIHAFQTDPNV
jgi:hypothetical protein